MKKELLNQYPKYRTELTNAVNKFNGDFRKSIEPIVLPVFDFLSKLLKK